MKAREWREKSIGERESTALVLSDKLRTLRFEIASRETKNHREYRKIRKDIARLKTIATESKKD